MRVKLSTRFSVASYNFMAYPRGHFQANCQSLHCILAFVMTSYLPFSLASSSTTPANDDVEVTVALSSDVYSNGEQVSATVRFQRPQPAKSQQSHERRSASPKLPKRLVRIGPKNVTSSRSLRAVQDGPYSPGADVQFRAPSIRSQMNHTRNDGRRTQSLAIGKNVSAQEMIWALGKLGVENAKCRIQHDRTTARCRQAVTDPHFLGNRKTCWTISSKQHLYTAGPLVASTIATAASTCGVGLIRGLVAMAIGLWHRRSG